MRRLLIMLLVIIGVMSSSMPTQAQDALLDGIPGKIAYIGSDLNVYIVHAGTGETSRLTNDANDNQRYVWPTWSPHGRLAAFVNKIVEERIVTDVFVGETNGAELERLVRLEDRIFTYAAWSPKPCDSALGGCLDLAVLTSNPMDGVFNLDLIPGNRNQIDDNIVSNQGTPFFFSWSPDGQKMLWHRNDQFLEVFDIASQRAEAPLSHVPGVFQAPAWSPVDNRLLVGTVDATNATTLTLLDNETSLALADNLIGPVRFSWSLDGERIAYVDNFGVMIIVDAVSGNEIIRVNQNGILSFFWSPDSQKVAYITLSGGGDALNVRRAEEPKRAALMQREVSLAWSVLDLSTGLTRQYGSFQPTREMIYLFSFFDQFAQSHRIWSPDSRYILYTDVTSEREALVRLLDVSTANALPVGIAAGSIAIWSFN